MEENGKRNRMRKKTLQSNDATVNGDGRDAVKWSQSVSLDTPRFEHREERCIRSIVALNLLSVYCWRLRPCNSKKKNVTIVTRTCKHKNWKCMFHLWSPERRHSAFWKRGIQELRCTYFWLETESTLYYAVISKSWLYLFDRLHALLLRWCKNARYLKSIRIWITTMYSS